MNVKTFSFGIVIVLVTAVLAAGLTVVGTKLLRNKESDDGNFLSRLFTSTHQTQVEFVEVKNLVIALKGENNEERYLLLEINLATDSAENVKKTQDMLPAVRGATVGLLTDMDYRDVRAMSVNELHDKLKAAYIERFSSLKMSMPFNDLIISKMVFQ